LDSLFVLVHQGPI